MKDDTLIRRLRAARPAAREPGEQDALFARIVAEPGDPRSVQAAHGGPSRFLGRGRKARQWTRARPRVLAGGTLGLAGICVALVLALSAGGAAAPPAFAITTNSDGSVLVKLANVEAVPAAERQLATMGLHEWFEGNLARGAAPVSGPVNCTAPTRSQAAGVRDATHRSTSGTITGPPVKVLLGTNGTSSVPSGDPGAGTWHVFNCYLYSGPFPGVGNTGNTGAG